jgi:hypothetical protein
MQDAFTLKRDINAAMRTISFGSNPEAGVSDRQHNDNQDRSCSSA